MGTNSSFNHSFSEYRNRVQSNNIHGPFQDEAKILLQMQ